MQDFSKSPSRHIWIPSPKCPPVSANCCCPCRGCVGSDTVSWFTRTAAALPKVPSIAFIHIPVTEFMYMYNDFPTKGLKGEGVACGLVNTGTFQALKAAGVEAIYSGHDHRVSCISMLTLPAVCSVTRSSALAFV